MKTYSYEEVIHTIENTRRFGSLTGYQVSKEMLEGLGNPQSGIPFVHVAGTNGKGSTTAFLCKILEQSGKKIGMFTSPHLITFEERIRINGNYIPKEEVTRLGNWLLNTDFAVSPTMFDYCLAMAVLYFKEQGCDLMVMETGIGGRYDSTNALGIPEVAVITKIGFDHMAVLGNTLEEIAGEKAGIIKPGCDVVISPQEKSVEGVLLEEYLKVNQIHKEEDFMKKDSPLFRQVTFADIEAVSGIPMKMRGNFQLENAATAMLAARAVFEKNKHWFSDTKPEISQQKQMEWIEKGICETFWKGRMELINTQPFFMIDGAHNAHGVHALAESLKTLYPGEKFHFIMAVMADKDYEDMIEELLPLALDFVTVTPESSRALQSKDLAECIEKKGITAVFAEDLETTIMPYLPKKQEDILIEVWDGTKFDASFCNSEKTIAFGSLYFIGAIEAMLEKNNKQD